MSMAELDKRTHSVTTSRVEKRSNYVSKKSTETSETEDVKRYEERGNALRNNNYEMNGTKDHDKMQVELSDEEEEEEEQDGIKPSVDPNEVAKRFSQAGKENNTLCKICGKFVYQMEKVKAEKNIFHKSCFRCKECNKALTVDSYSSHEGDIYCKQHFKLLFQPKVKFEDDAAPKRPRKHEMIIRENIPAELPPDVVRSNSKADDILDNINLDLTNIKSRFESGGEEYKLPSHTDMLRLQRCDSLMLRLAKYQSAIAGENENGDIQDSDSEDDEDRDPSVVRESRKREKVAFHDMDNLKSQWETGALGTREERKDEIKDEVNRIRQRLCLGRSESMRQVYEKACQDSGRMGPRRSDTINLGRDIKAGHIKEKFEKGDVEDKYLVLEKVEKIRKEREEDLSVFTEPGTATTARSLFKQIDANVQTLPPIRTNKSPSVERSRSRTFSTQSSVDGEVVKCSEPAEKEEIQVETTEVSERFKFFENFKEEKKERKRFQITPPRETKKEESPEVEIPRDPNVVRSGSIVDDIPMTDTAKRMLDKFKALENGEESAPKPSGPKPLKRITPPREFTRQDKDKDSSPEPERDPSIVRSSYKVEDDIVVEADKAKLLREKFEKWEAEMKELEPDRNEEDEYLPQADTAKNLKAKFEAIKEEVLKPKEKPKPRVRRFI
ncbi:protein-methionine sulfoxide oxidase mical3b-like [Centruroides sculpturatus]|uniref:protein-methionine sulfoxide oxidase mical3b-like n=1 Tax=Centruroides sculpturatus TaxID=218467 RepID=UPI000C6C8D5E|nr:protein-methionine sulfoxide oxidase mical3b-like [Centruroides sculpturatus]